MVGNDGRLEVGGNVFEWDFSKTGGHFDALVVGGKTRVGLTAEEGFLLLDVLMLDVQGNSILEIERGEMKISTGVWDYRIEGQKLQINSAPREIELEMKF